MKVRFREGALTRSIASTCAGQLHVQALDTAWRGSERGGHRESLDGVLQISLGCLMVYKYRTSDSGDEFLSCWVTHMPPSLQVRKARWTARRR